jgi:hypothetical protein
MILKNSVFSFTKFCLFEMFSVENSYISEKNTIGVQVAQV